MVHKKKDKLLPPLLPSPVACERVEKMGTRMVVRWPKSLKRVASLNFNDRIHPRPHQALWPLPPTLAMKVDTEVATGKRLGDGRWSRPGPAGTPP
jgi:hypothetical protein